MNGMGKKPCGTKEIYDTANPLDRNRPFSLLSGYGGLMQFQGSNVPSQGSIRIGTVIGTCSSLG